MKKLLLALALLALPSVTSAQMPDNIAPFVQVTSTVQRTTITMTDGNGFPDLNINSLRVIANGIERTDELFLLILDGSATVALVNNGFRITIPGDFRLLPIYASIRDRSGRLGSDTNQN